MPVTYRHEISGTFYDIDVWITGLFTVDPTDSVVGSHDVWLTAIGELWSPGSAGNDGWASVCTPGVVLTAARTYSLATFSRKKTGRQETSLNIPGTAAGDAIPPTVAPMVLLDTLGTAGHKSGRMYLPAPHTGSWDSGRLDPTRFALLGTCVSKTLLSLRANGLHPCNIDTQTGEIQEITDIRASNKCAVRKSRDDGAALYTPVHIFP